MFAIPKKLIKLQEELVSIQIELFLTYCFACKHANKLTFSGPFSHFFPIHFFLHPVDLFSFNNTEWCSLPFKLDLKIIRVVKTIFAQLKCTFTPMLIGKA